MQKIVYIYGLGYSGSTILDLILRLHPKIIGFGELYPIFKEQRVDFSQYQCTCGETLNQCNFWNDFEEIYNKYFGQDYSEMYKRFLHYFSKKENDKIIVDSSKRKDVLKILLSNFSEQIDFKIIYLLRDVRAFSISARQHRNVEKGKWGNVFLYHLGWWKRQRSFKKFLDQNNLDYFQLGYEELCFQTEKALKDLCDFISVSFREEMLRAPKFSSSHTIGGNAMRLEQNKLESIQYDNRWMKDYGVNLSYSLLPWVAWWNNKNVYHNINSN